MRVLIVGATGMLGSAVSDALLSRGHEVIGSSRSSTIRVDLSDSASIEAMFANAGSIHAVAVTAGSTPMKPFSEFSVGEFAPALQNKLIGQLQIVRAGLDYVSPSGSFTLVSGASSRDPIRGGSILAAVNSAIDGFVQSAALEMPRRIRINSVNATVFTEAMSLYDGDFPGFASVPVADVARAYVKSIEGVQTGRNYLIG